MRNARIFAVALALTAAGLAAFAADAPLAFKDVMQDLGLAEPGYGWHSYHDTIVCADWDGDGDVDVLVVTSLHEKSALGSQGRLYVNLLKETGSFAFEDRTETLMPDGINGKMIADGAPFFFDVNSDGRLDICSISDEGKPCTYINEGDKFRMEGWGFVAQTCTIRDVDGDGLLDVIGNDTGTLYTNEGGGKFKAGKVEGSLSGLALRQQELLTSRDISRDERLEPAVRSALVARGAVSVTVVPLAYEGQPLGTLSLVYREVAALDTLDLVTLRAIGHEVSLALANAGHLADLDQEAVPDLVAEGLVDLLEA